MIDWMSSTLAGIYDLGGPVVMLLGVISIISLSAAIYKLIQFSVARVGARKTLNIALKSAETGDLVSTRKTLASDRHFLRPVLEMAALGQAEYDVIAAQAETRFLRLERGLRLLDSIAQLAPLLGLFGTVLGMISAFQALQEAGSQVDPSILAGGIWVALLTTAVGLAVAMPTALVVSWFEGRMEAERVFTEAAVQRLLKARRDHA